MEIIINKPSVFTTVRSINIIKSKIFPRRRYYIPIPTRHVILPYFEFVETT